MNSEIMVDPHKTRTRNNNQKIISHINSHNKLIQDILENNEVINIISEIALIAIDVLENKGTIYWCGNGGSASDSQHLSAELVGRFKKNRLPLRSIALSADTATLTCISNDFSYDEVFSRQLEAFATKNDLVICLSTSGKSQNIIKALKDMSDLKVPTFALLGKGGGESADYTKKTIIIPSNVTALIQEAHIMIGHIICDIVDEHFTQI